MVTFKAMTKEERRFFNRLHEIDIDEQRNLMMKKAKFIYLFLIFFEKKLKQNPLRQQKIFHWWKEVLEIQNLGCLKFFAQCYHSPWTLGAVENRLFKVIPGMSLDSSGWQMTVGRRRSWIMSLVVAKKIPAKSVWDLRFPRSASSSPATNLANFVSHNL